MQPSMQFVAGLDVAPDRFRVAAVVVDDGLRERLHPLAHRPGEPMDGRRTLAHGEELVGIHRRDLRRIELRRVAAATCTDPVNAHSIGTCWSSSIPNRRANGLLSKRRSASGLPVMGSFGWAIASDCTSVSRDAALPRGSPDGLRTSQRHVRRSSADGGCGAVESAPSRKRTSTCVPLVRSSSSPPAATSRGPRRADRPRTSSA